MSKFIGKGSYGQVSSKNGFAVKKFNNIKHLIQEYAALRYCQYSSSFVKVYDVNYDTLEFRMKLYDCNLREWIDEGKHTMEEKLNLLRDILRALVDLHDRNLAHGDVTPKNIMIQKHPLRAILGDFGFVSIAKYTKVEKTAPSYREKRTHRHPCHDIYSFAIIATEMLLGTRLGESNGYTEMSRAIESIKNRKYANALMLMITPNYKIRITSAQALETLYEEKRRSWKWPSYTINSEILEIRKTITDISTAYSIPRSKQTYIALINHLSKSRGKNNIKLYAYSAMLITSSIFGSSNYTVDDIKRICGKGNVNDILTELTTNDTYLSILLSP